MFQSAKGQSCGRLADKEHEQGATCNNTAALCTKTLKGRLSGRCFNFTTSNDSFSPFTFFSILFESHQFKLAIS